MKFLILLFTLRSSFLLAGDVISTPKSVKYYKQIDKSYDKMETKSEKKCDACGEIPPAVLLPYHGEDIPLAKTFPCSEVKGCGMTLFYEE
jgi:hypothetical protein